MGYRSNVVCLLYGSDTQEDNAMVKEFVRVRLEAYRTENIPIDDCFNFEGWGVKFQCTQWKWFDTYPEIKFLQELFAEFDEAFIDGNNDSTYALEFYRIGEEDDDIEFRHKGFIEGRMYLNRSIVVDGNNT